MQPRRYTTTVEDGGRGRIVIPVPFDPDAVWAVKAVHHVTGTVGGVGLRATVDSDGGRRVLVMGPAWGRDRHVVAGQLVDVVLAPEGPQRGELAEDLAAALEANPAAGAFFDSLAQFYTRAYLRWIDGTRRRPEERARRIAHVVELLERGVKQRP